MSKELWFAEMERLMANGASYESACYRAHVTSMERLYDHADYLRKAAREDGALKQVGSIGAVGHSDEVQKPTGKQP